MTPSSARTTAPCLFLLALCTLLTGCTLETTAPATPSPGLSLQGTVFGGQAPIAGAQVYLFAAGTSGYGGSSVSLLGPATNTKEDTSYNYYVTSDVNGKFSITGDYLCAAGSQVYLAAFNGYPSVGAELNITNTALALLAGLGTCPSTGTFASTVPLININEVSTVATAYALAGFMTDATHVSSTNTDLAKTGVMNAFANITNLETISTGSALAMTPTGGVAPQATLNTLADILATCVNSNDTFFNTDLFSDPCNALFNQLTNDGTPDGPKPNNTVTAILDIAHYPAINVPNLFGLSAGTSAPFQPTLPHAPTDFTLGLSFTNGFSAANAIAVDASGNLYIADGYNASLVELSSLGAAVSPSGGWGAFTGNSGLYIGQQSSLAIDNYGYVWIADGAGVLKFTSSGAEISSGSGFSVGNSNVHDLAVAIDGGGYVWTANSYSGTNAGSISKLTNSGGLLSPPAGYGGGVILPYAIAMDGAGSAWVNGANKLSKFSNTGSALVSSTGSPSTSFAIAIDASGNAWAANESGNSLSKFSNSGVSSGNYTGGGLSEPNAIAIDGAGNIWAANDNSSAYSISEISNTGTIISPSTGYASALFGQYLSPNSIAVDGSGNVWLACNISSSGPVSTVPTVLELIGAATPVITPIAAGLPSTFTTDGSSNLGTRP